MTTLTAPAPKPRHRFSVDQYFRMIDAGILNEHDHVELIHGEIRPKMAKGDDHDSAVESINRMLGRLIPEELSFRCQSVLRMTTSAPEPDFAICNSPASRKGKHPKPSDTFLVIEVSDTTLSDDRGERLELLAENQIPEYWIVNIPDQWIEVYTMPVCGVGWGYAKRTDFRSGQFLPLFINGRDLGAIPVSAILSTS